ncbi:MAG: hypothetical protein F4Y98_00270 [Chloroflexi bacterium]|nr:hypothetical protein [Chloroflexota bacterium]
MHTAGTRGLGSLSSTDVQPLEPPSDDRWIETAEALMHDECWCWGQDVLYPDGNLLIRYGLERTAALGADGRTAGYTGSINDRGGVWLRGAGVFYSSGSGSGIFLGRYDMRPRVITRDAPPLDTWIERGLDAFPLATASEQGIATACLLVPEACAWIAAYEHWITEAVGVEHREECLERWARGETPAGEFAQRWDALGRGFRTETLFLS